MVLEKNVAREKFRRLRAEHPLEQKQLSDQALTARLTDFIAQFQPKNILAYRPLKTEANPFSHDRSNDYAYPEVSGEVFHALKQGQLMDPQSLDMVLIPGIAFDRHGNRLGFGKGFYDRFLKTTSGHRVGIAYSFQVSSEELACEAWDQRVDWIVTERYVLHVERKDQKWKS